jgi:hypothetical protein
LGTSLIAGCSRRAAAAVRWPTRGGPR